LLQIKNELQKISLRKIDQQDAETLFEWANDPVVRANSIHTEPIKWDTHLAWLQSRLAAGTVMLMLEVDGKPAGQLRFDYDTDHQCWKIDYSISAEQRGKGLGKKIIEEGLVFLDKFPVVAFVKPENIPSLRVFEALGFENKGTSTMDDVELVKFIKTARG
jgi:RimJ/RimL family protein N-acetyltransferase